jgi:hypothetical protein
MACMDSTTMDCFLEAVKELRAEVSDDEDEDEDEDEDNHQE